MNYKYLIFNSIFLLFFLVTPFSLSAADDADGEGSFKPTDMIVHHIKDDYGWHLYDYKDDSGEEHQVSISLPIILYTYEGSLGNGKLDVFMSNDFHHGEHDVQKGDNTYKLDHGHITEMSGKSILDFSVTKNVASMMISVVILFLVFFSIAGAYKKRGISEPKGLQSFFEPIILFIRDDIAIPNIGEQKYQKYLPYLITLFFFIWVNNLLGLIPTGANLSGNIAFTMTLAVFTLLVTNISGSKAYWSHLFWTPGVPLPLRIIVLPVELLGIITKPFALMVRLFANITAGHIIVLSLISFIFVFKQLFVGVIVGPVIIAMTMFELFVAIFQAYIFTLLSALFIGLALEDDHH
jgi:F-type H+-transporting ATPase subunit a